MPARFEVYILNDSGKYVIECETNFRVVMNNKNILCFNDIYLKNDYNEFTDEEFQSQKDIELSLLYKNLMNIKDLIVNTKITDCKISLCNDIELITSNNLIIQFINDVHGNLCSSFRILSLENKRNVNVSNEKVFSLPETVYEIKNDN